MKEKALVVFSGGQDSTTCLFWALAKGWDVHLLTFNYGQRHAIELEAAKKIAELTGLTDKHEILNVGPILKGTSPLVSDAPLEQYADHNSLPGGLEKTFVPMRNQLFLTIAANRAYVLGARNLVTGVSEEDFGGYPDCRYGFIRAIENACNEGAFTGKDGALEPLHIHTPLIAASKAKTVHMAVALEGCYAALAYSHTAYDGKYPPTGKDHATLLREKGFVEADVPDPLVVRAHLEGRMELPVTDNYRCSNLELYKPYMEEKWTS